MVSQREFSNKVAEMFSHQSTQLWPGRVGVTVRLSGG